MLGWRPPAAPTSSTAAAPSLAAAAPCPAPLLSTLLGGSPGQLAMRAQAVLPSFPHLPAPTSSSTSSSSSSSAAARPSTSSMSSTPSSSPPLTALQQLSRPTSPNQLHSRSEGGGSGVGPPPLPLHPHPQTHSASSPPFHSPTHPPILRVAHDDFSPTSPPSPGSVAGGGASVMVAVGGVGGVSGAGVMVGVGGVSGAGGGVGGRRDENVKVSQGMIAFLLEALQTTMFTKKKDAIDTYHTYLMAQHPRYSRADALLLLYGSPLTPQSTLSTFASTSSFTKIDRGLLAAAGQLSWKNHQLRASAAKALGLVALLLDGRYNADAAVFQALLAEADYTVIKLMKLPKHLSQPSPASSAVGNLHAALRVLDILKDIRPDLIDTLLQEKDVAHGRAAPLTHPHTAPPSALSIVAGGSGASSSSSSPPPPLAVHLLHVSGSGAERERDSGASTPKATADASPRSPHSPPPLPPSHAALHFPLTPTSSTFHTAPHPLNLAAVDAAASSSDASQPPHYSHQPNVALPFSAASSPMGRSRKHFGTMQGGLQSSVVPQQQKGQWSSPATSAPQSVGVDDWKQRLRGHLSGFFASRMSREELELKGVLKAPRVFGLSLEALALHDEVDEESNVPRILRCCMLRLSAAEQLALPGLFRISGDSREIAELKVKWDVGRGGGPLRLLASLGVRPAQDVAEGAAGASADLRAVPAAHRPLPSDAAAPLSAGLRLSLSCLPPAGAAAVGASAPAGPARAAAFAASPHSAGAAPLPRPGQRCVQRQPHDHQQPGHLLLTQHPPTSRGDAAERSQRHSHRHRGHQSAHRAHPTGTQRTAANSRSSPQRTLRNGARRSAASATLASCIARFTVAHSCAVRYATSASASASACACVRCACDVRRRVGVRGR